MKNHIKTKKVKVIPMSKRMLLCEGFIQDLNLDIDDLNKSQIYNENEIKRIHDDLSKRFGYIDKRLAEHIYKKEHNLENLKNLVRIILKDELSCYNLTLQRVKK